MNGLLRVREGREGKRAGKGRGQGREEGREGKRAGKGRGQGKEEGGGLQMFPRQTNRTETGLGDLESLIVVFWDISWSVACLVGGRFCLCLSLVELRAI